MKRLDLTASGDTKFSNCTNFRETAALNTERLVGKGIKAASFKGLLKRGNVNLFSSGRNSPNFKPRRRGKRTWVTAATSCLVAEHWMCHSVSLSVIQRYCRHVSGWIQARQLRPWKLCWVAELLSELKNISNSSLKGCGRFIQSFRRPVSTGHGISSLQKWADAGWRLWNSVNSHRSEMGLMWDLHNCVSNRGGFKHISLL